MTLLVGQQEGHLACKKTDRWDAGVVMFLGQGADLHMTQHPTTQFFTGRMPFLPPTQQHQSTEGVINLAYKFQGYVLLRELCWLKIYLSACSLFMYCYLITGLEDFLSGSDLGHACEQGSLPDGLMTVSEQTLTATWTLSHSSQMYTWSSQPQMQTVLRASEQSGGGLNVSGLTEGARQSSVGVLSCTSAPRTSVMSSQLSVIADRYPAETETVPVHGPLLSSAHATHHSSVAHEVKLQPVERSDIVSSAGDLGRQRTLTAVELGNVHLRDLLSQDDDDNPDVSGGSGESPQQPQSTSCDDPPDSSTGNVRSSGETSILKQLLSDSDTDEHNEASVCEPPQTTRTGNKSHVLLKVSVHGCVTTNKDYITATITVLTGHTSATLLASCQLANTV